MGPPSKGRGIRSYCGEERQGPVASWWRKGNLCPLWCGEMGLWVLLTTRGDSVLTLAMWHKPGPSWQREETPTLSPAGGDRAKGGDRTCACPCGEEQNTAHSSLREGIPHPPLWGRMVPWQWVVSPCPPWCKETIPQALLGEGGDCTTTLVRKNKTLGPTDGSLVPCFCPIG